MWFDVREFWQVLSAIMIVGGSCGGAFILSYFTPTVGLGCRSGGYTIFFSIALGLMIVEMTVWLVTSPYEMRVPWLAWSMTQLRKSGRFGQWETRTQQNLLTLRHRASSFGIDTENKIIRFISWLRQTVSRKHKVVVRRKAKRSLEDLFQKLRETSTSRKWELFFFRPLEAFNTIWLVSHRLSLPLRSRVLLVSSFTEIGPPLSSVHLHYPGLYRPRANLWLVQDMRLCD
jgi:hypothetical protein